MKAVTIECPNCGYNDNLNFNTNVVPVVITCPNCDMSFLGFQEKVFKLDQKRVKDLFNGGNPQDINDYFWSVIGYPNHQTVTRTKTDRDSIITKDEILNLKIDLNVSKTVGEFLSKLS